MGRGVAGAPLFCAGLLLGDIIWLACAVFGLAVLAELFHPVFVAIKYLGVAYLLYLAWKLWTAPVTLPTATKTPPGAGLRLVLGGLALTLGNPKTTLFYLALVPALIPLAELTWVGFVELSAVISVVYGAVLAGYVALAARARRAFRNPKALRLVNRTTGAMMAGASVAIATRA